MAQQKNNYQYPARSSERGVFLKSNSDEERWTSIEQYIFSLKVLPFLETKMGGTVVDIGTGEGGYIFKVRNIFSKFIIIEPDSSRLNKAKERLKDVKEKVEAINDFARNLEFGQHSMDAFMCIHVLQHISEEEAKKILDKAARWLKIDGILTLFFTQKTKHDYEYNSAWMQDGKPKYFPISKEAFRILAEDNLSETLLVRKIKLEKILESLEKLGFKVKVVEPYKSNHSSKLWLRLIGFLLWPFPLIWRHKILRTFRFKAFVDVCIIAQKR